MKGYRDIKKAIDKEIRQGQSLKEPYRIDMNVSDDSEFLSKFSTSETPVISREVADFIEQSTPTIRKDETLTLRIKSNCIDEKEKEIYPSAVREYYKERYISNKRELMRDYVIAAILALAGILVLALAIFVGHHSTIWSEVVDIVAWVFIWEAVYIAFLETRKLKLDNRKYIAYISMKVEYIDK